MTITLFFLTLTAFNSAAATTQLIQNGGFEDGTTGWETMGRADFRGRQPSVKMIIYVGCQISVVDTDMYAGQKSLKVDHISVQPDTE